jgi:DNA-binding beta-propeller fold protein YncE
MSSYNSNIFLFSFGKEGQFVNPTGVTCDHGGNIVVCDSSNHRIQIFSKEGEFIRSFGSKGEEEGEFRWPKGVTCDHDGNIIVCDTVNHRIQIFSSKGKFLFSFGERGREEGQFEFPEGVTCDQNGNIVVCDTYNHRIQIFKFDTSNMSTIGLQGKFDPKGKFLFSFGEYGEEEGQFNCPVGITCDHDGNIVVSDTRNHRIQVFDPKGKFLFSFGEFGREEGQFQYPTVVTCDKDRNIVVPDSESDRIQVFKCEPSDHIDLQSKFKFDTSKMFPIDLQSKLTYKVEFIRSFGKFGREEGQFYHPRGVTCDHDGNYLVCDTWNHRIQVFKGPSEVPTLLSLCWKQVINLL